MVRPTPEQARVELAKRELARRGVLQDEGIIGPRPPLGSRLLARGKRVAGFVGRGLIGDVPFVRKLLPEQVQKLKPALTGEVGIEPITRLGRDILGLKGIGKLGLARTALRGAGLGLATAGTEEPKEILGAGIRGAAVLPVVKVASEKMITPFIQKIARKGLKATQQAWQDLIRAGFMVEKSTIERVQQKGIGAFFTKATNPKLGISNRHDDAYLRLGQKIFDSAQKLRRNAGQIVGRWRNRIFNNPRIKVDIAAARQEFQRELAKPEVRLLGAPLRTEIGRAELGTLGVGAESAQNRLLQVNQLLQESGDIVNPDLAYRIIDSLDDIARPLRGTNMGRIVTQLRSSIKSKIYAAAPTNIREGLRSADKKFATIADATDDVFDKLKLEIRGVATKERVGATESALAKGLKKATSKEERNIWTTLDALLPQEDKFMELYKDVFAAQDLQREGIGWLMRRLFLAPRMAARGLQITQPPFRMIGKGLELGGRAARTISPAAVFRKTIEKEQ